MKRKSLVVTSCLVLLVYCASVSPIQERVLAKDFANGYPKTVLAAEPTMAMWVYCWAGVVATEHGEKPGSYISDVFRAFGDSPEGIGRKEEKAYHKYLLDRGLTPTAGPCLHFDKYQDGIDDKAQTIDQWKHDGHDYVDTNWSD